MHSLWGAPARRSSEFTQLLPNDLDCRPVTAKGSAPRPEPAQADRARLTFTRGRKAPRGIRWYGVGSFWGHLQHFIASGIATEDIDSRDWMHADDPLALARDVATHLTTGAVQPGESLTEMLGRDLIVDFVADTGDDSSVSEAVAKMVFSAWELPDPDHEGATISLPRGDVLLFGGDTAYPVATANEINDRVVVPFNRVLASVRHLDPPGTRRAILGIPGNHDWYDGLDGFGRLFKRRIGDLTLDQEEPNLTPERESRFEHVAKFVEKFVVGGQIEKQKVLVLEGYVPFQQASYFAMPLAPRVDWLAADRQLRAIDFRQRKYFANFREHRRNSLFVMLPDPVYAFQEVSVTGMQMARSLELDLEHTPHFVISGDIHHYERLSVDASLHVTAGGGGAFTHPARLGGEKLPVPVKQFPGVQASRALLRVVPFHVAFGGAGFVPHLVMLAVFAPALEIGVRFSVHAIAACIAGVIAAIAFAFIGDIRYRPPGKAMRVGLLATFSGAVMGLVPPLVSLGFSAALARLGVHTTARAEMLLTLLIATFTGALMFGFYLAALTAFGLESTQAFTCLGLPGYKHFVRLRVRRDGSAIDAWVIGKVDPLDEQSKPELVDHFSWRPRG